MKSSYTIPLAIVLGGIIVALAVYVSMPKAPSTDSGNGDPALVRPVGTADHILGNPAAKVMLVEYADFDCEYCKGFDDTLHQIVANEGANGSVAWVYREFPLTEIHPNAMKHAEAAECAAQVGGNDLFWKFADTLFANQPVDPSQYGTFAKNLGIPGDAFAACFSNASSTVDARILADRQNALDMGAQGTPFSVILVTGKPPVVIGGAYPYDAVKQLVDAALQSAK
ncbi:MAG TPA: thioredoxin domain-containing protein [Candidatus Paceibacterota bacterium]|nr:thioredoxin domain-containing protein [Candidatus Paceibacterota bacterium]